MNPSSRFTIILLAVLALVPSAHSIENAKRAWRVSGFIAPLNKKVWVSVSEGKIVCIDDETKKDVAPEATNCVAGYDTAALKNAPSVASNDYIFPGMMDLHNHIEFNSLPLWKDAKGQFTNRFEWRETDSYQNGPHKFFMRLMKLEEKDPDYATFSDFNCLSLQWAEIKALAGGITAIQGLGRIQNGVCTKDFGIRNLEIANTMGLADKTIGGTVEVINPDDIKNGFNVFIAPFLNESMSNYKDALASFDEQFAISAWLNDFKTQDHTIENGIRLSLGPIADKYLKNQAALNEESASALITKIVTSEGQKLDIKDPDAAINKILAWLFEQNINGVSYLDVQPNTPDIEKTALAFLSPDKFNRNAMKSDAVLHIPRGAREYIVGVELGKLVSLRSRLASGKILGYLTHLGEGRREDSYNALEYSYAKALGLMTPNFLPIHGVGFSDANLVDMGKNGNGLILSPFSNLLLYGESARIKTAIKNNVTIALGSDWSITGSKNLIDEAQILNGYAKKEGLDLTSRQLSDILTVNAAKVLKLDTDGGFGKIDLGRQADLILVSANGADGYASLVNAKSENINLVSVRGEPLYGNAAALTKLGEGLGDTEAPESIGSLLASDTDCASLKTANKAFRLVSWSDNKTRTSVKEVKAKLEQRFKDATTKFQTVMKSKESLSLDPIYSCQDKTYRDAMKEVLR